MSRDQARIRMYNVGFGDCFLLSWPGPDRTVKVLIDCGSHRQGAGPHKIEKVVERIVEDVRESDGTPRIDVVVGTHRHQDHVSGFDSPLWDDVAVTEVWMPWTEHPTDPEARRIRETQSRAAKRLHAEASIASALPAEEELLRESLLALSANSLTNAQAMETLHHGFKGRPKRRFLPTETRRRKSFETACLPGALVHVLGPSRDPDVIRDMNPPAGQSYLRMTEERESHGEGPWSPFRPLWKVTREEMERDHAHLMPERPNYLRTIHNLGEMDSEIRLDLAVQLEKGVNGTSLVLVFEIGRACLLFPGDAQWGTWRVALEDPDWRNLLARTSFCKVGHHGSHNATPKELLDGALGESFAAMISTRSMSNWPDIPRTPLLERLAEKTGHRVVRSDLPPSEMPAGFRPREETDLFFDLEIPL
jgi:beta-lactamase superfamily II metal-dependent hydrolase